MMPDPVPMPYTRNIKTMLLINAMAKSEPAATNTPMYTVLRVPIRKLRTVAIGVRSIGKQDGSAPSQSVNAFKVRNGSICKWEEDA